MARTVLTVWVLLLLSPAIAFAQGNRGVGALAGVVKDASGAVLPGVTIEAASPALIEKVRTTVTDDQGQYQITDLRPGTYAITFTLPGFNTLKREGIDLPPNFTAPVNVELKIGDLAETVTVSGQSPVVDVQNVTQQRVVSRAVLDAIPTAKGEKAFAALTPAVISPATSQDVGGSQGEVSVRMAIHGGKQGDQKLLQDGMRYNSMNIDGAARGFYINPATAQEVVIDLGAGGSAEYSTGGTQVNLIPKDGGNIFNAYFYTAYTNNQLQGRNLTTDLRARGLSTANGVRLIYDVNGAFGGPILHDRLWFYSAHRWWGKTLRVANLFHNAAPVGSYVYTPDPSAPTDLNDRQMSHNLRLTWQAAAKDKITVSFDWERHCLDNNGSPLVGVAWEAATNICFGRDYLSQATWSRPATNKLLLEAGATLLAYDSDGRNLSNLGSPLPDGISILEQTINFRYGAPLNFTREIQPQTNERFSMSYITGSHRLKVGAFAEVGTYRRVLTYNRNALGYTSSNGSPIQLTEYASPLDTKQSLHPEIGLFAQDQWKLKQLTLNFGLRFEYLHSYVPASESPATLLIGARSFAKVDCVPCWKDLNPRFGASYDLSGNGKTALKASLGRYVQAQTVSIALANDPVISSVNQVNRSWTDSNRNFVPDCDLRDPATNGECGPMSNANFGNPNVTTHYDPEVLNGWQHRPYQWQMSGVVEHELRSDVSISAGYFRTWYGNFLVTDNKAVTPSDYNPYCFAAPVDPRLAGGGGGQICGLYDITPSKFGLVNNLVTFASKYGVQTEHYTGVDFNLNARLPHGALVAGGLNIGNALSTGGTFTTSSTSRCFIVNSPQELYQCKVSVPHQARVKVFAAYPLPWGLQAAANFQSLPGAPYDAIYNVPTAAIAPTLGRNLAGGARTAPVDLITPYSKFQDRINQLDLRLSRIVKVGRYRLQGNLDLYNALNASPPLSVNTTYGPSWLVPQQILDARLFKVGFQVEF